MNTILAKSNKHSICNVMSHFIYLQPNDIFETCTFIAPFVCVVELANKVWISLDKRSGYHWLFYF